MTIYIRTGIISAWKQNHFTGWVLHFGIKGLRMNRPEVTESSGNVFLDLGFSEEEARASLVKAELVLTIQKAMEAAGWTQEETAKKIGMKQPRLSTMLRGDFRNVSESKLLDCIMKLGCDVKITIKRPQTKTTQSGRLGKLRIVST